LRSGLVAESKKGEVIMATATNHPSQSTAPTPGPQLIEKPQTVPIKVGVFGGQGSGKTTSTALMALALSKEIYGGAPVAVTDTEPGWQFLKPMFAVEGVELIQTTQPTFKAMLRDLRDAERRGCCVWAIDSLTIIWQEIMQAAQGTKGQIEIQQWGDIKAVWGQYTTEFLNSALSAFALGRLGNDMEEVIDDKSGKTRLTKVGTKFKAGGSESFGYEPHLLLEMSLERKAKRKAGSKLEGEGRMVHRVDVLKDRTWALNGAVIRWSDKPRYEKGGYRTVWQSLRPHFERVQQTMARVVIEPGASSADLFNADGNSEWYQNRQRKDVLSAELHCTMDSLWGGSAVAAKQMRMKVFEHIFGFKSKEAADAASLDKIERGVRILQAFEKRCKSDDAILANGELEILAQLDIDIRQHDEGEAEESSLPF
jgi:hypothetical protein